jgi:hypothetical protein
VTKTKGEKPMMTDAEKAYRERIRELIAELPNIVEQIRVAMHGIEDYTPIEDQRNVIMAAAYTQDTAKKLAEAVGRLAAIGSEIDGALVRAGVLKADAGVMMTDAEKAYRYYLQANSRIDEEEDDDPDTYDRVRAEGKAEGFKEALKLFDEFWGPNADPVWIRKGASGYDNMQASKADLDEPE